MRCVSSTQYLLREQRASYSFVTFSQPPSRYKTCSHNKKKDEGINEARKAQVQRMMCLFLSKESQDEEGPPSQNKESTQAPLTTQVGIVEMGFELFPVRNGSPSTSPALQTCEVVK